MPYKIDMTCHTATLAVAETLVAAAAVTLGKLHGAGIANLSVRFSEVDPDGDTVMVDVTEVE